MSHPEKKGEGSRKEAVVAQNGFKAGQEVDKIRINFHVSFMTQSVRWFQLSTWKTDDTSWLMSKISKSKQKSLSPLTMCLQSSIIHSICLSDLFNPGRLVLWLMQWFVLVSRAQALILSSYAHWAGSELNALSLESQGNSIWTMNAWSFRHIYMHEHTPLTHSHINTMRLWGIHLEN